MEATRLLILLVLISSCLSSTWVQGRVHHNHHHHHHKQSNQSIALPPNADSPTEPPEPYTPGSDENSTALPPAPPPHRNNSGSYANSTSVPTAPPPSGPYTNSTNSTSIPSAPAPAPINAGSNRNNKNSTSPPPTSTPTPTPAPPPSPTSVPTAPPPSGSNTNSTNSTTIPSAPAPAPITGGSNGNSTNSTSLPLAPAHPPAPTDAASNWNGSNSTAVFNVRSYGAVGNGVADDTEAFKSAWDSACQDGQGVLLAPQGYTFMIRSTIFAGPCQNAVVFQLDGVLVAPDGPDSWPENNSKRQWLVFYRADGMTLQGGGIIDGRGEKWWNLPCKPHRGINGTTLPGPCDSPVTLRFFMGSNLTVHGLKIRNSPQFHFRFDNCRNVTINSITINSPALSPNTDGIHVENSNTVGIYNSVISNGDDCISIGSGSFNVDIMNITCGPSHGISIGSLGKQNSRACVTNITVTNTIIKHSDNGVRIKTWQGGSGAVSSITFANIHMDTVRNPIIIDQYYCLSKGCTNQTSAVYISDVSYKNIKGTYDRRSPPIHFGCSDSVPCTNITMTEVELLPAQGDIILDPFCWNVYGASQTLTIPPISCLLEGLPRSIMEVDAERCY